MIRPHVFQLGQVPRGQRRSSNPLPLINFRAAERTDFCHPLVDRFHLGPSSSKMLTSFRSGMDTSRRDINYDISNNQAVGLQA